MQYLISLISIFFLITGCSVGVMNIQSSPEGADVYLQAGSQQPNKIGQTPMNISSQTVNSLPVDSFKIQVKKEGFDTETFVIPKIMFSSSIDISTKLKEDTLAESCKDQNSAIEKAVRSVALVQFHIQQKNYLQAESVLSSLILEFPNNSVLYDLQGNVYYLQKNVDAALTAYKQSLKLNPNNPSTRRMVNKLEIIGGRVPSAEGGL
ncbi:MAG: tetratricopeptide repeat protein [Bdellovibrionales bacterium]|nr:tetratricopeptide repeat protein [Bdellovibrionales bacterium]